MLVQTRTVLAGAYLKRYPHTTLSHAVEVDSAGNELRVLCGRVALDSLADPYANDTNEKPTCATCARRDPR
jgi:hypothetical protein